MEWPGRMRWWLAVQGRRVPLWLVVVLVTTAVTTAAYHWLPRSSWLLGQGEWDGVRFLHLPRLGLLSAGVALVSLLVTRWVVVRSPEGPLTVSTILDATST